MATFAVGGFQHETNTFAPVMASLEAFKKPKDWPSLCIGEDMLKQVHGVHIPITGAIQTLQAAGHQIAPLLWCSATPSNRVTKEAFETISALMLAQLQTQLPLDGVYLDLHGAMVTEEFEDGEGELLRRIRALLGPDMPISISIDLHANVTQAMVDHASVIDCYREYPHIDMSETGARAAAALLHLQQNGQARPAFSLLKKIPFQIPITWGCTLINPARGVYEQVHSIAAKRTLLSFGFANGFPLADIHETGPAVFAFGDSQAEVENAVNDLYAYVLERESEFAGTTLTPTAAIKEARHLLETRGGPVIFADTQDNPGGGGAGDTTGLFRALVESGIESALVAMIHDPALAKKAHETGEGKCFKGSLGEGSHSTDSSPFEGEFTVIKLGDGNCVATGPMFKGANIQIGLCALLQHGNVRVMVGSSNMQLADQAILRHLGVEPSKEQIIALKSSVHFRADFQPIASDILVVDAPGPVCSDLNQLDYQHIRADIRRMPRT